MGEVVHLRPADDVVAGLRYIADELESLPFKVPNATIIAGEEVYHLGRCGKEAMGIPEAVFNMNFGIHKLMSIATENED